MIFVKFKNTFFVKKTINNVTLELLSLFFSVYFLLNVNNHI